MELTKSTLDKMLELVAKLPNLPMHYNMSEGTIKALTSNIPMVKDEELKLPKGALGSLTGVKIMEDPSLPFGITDVHYSNGEVKRIDLRKNGRDSST